MLAFRDPQVLLVTLASCTVGTTTITTALRPSANSSFEVPLGSATSPITAPTGTIRTLSTNNVATVEIFTSTFTSTIVFTGVSLETHTISPNGVIVSSDVGKVGAAGLSTQSVGPTMTVTESPLPVVSATITFGHPIPSDVASAIVASHSSSISPTIPIQISSDSVTQVSRQTTSTSNYSATTSDDISNCGRPHESHNLARILPAVFLPIAFVVLLVYIALRRYRRNQARRERLLPVPFISSSNTASQSRSIGRDVFTRARKVRMRHVQGVKRSGAARAIAVVDQGGSTSHRPNGESGVALGRGQAIGYYPVSPETTMREHTVVPVIQAEILDIRARLTDIESREPLTSPPQYSLYVGPSYIDQ